jgi:glutamine phosphoribosylpyrophosphate amidotransferase
MCGVVGYISPNTPEHRGNLVKLIQESMYRGLHSVGIASHNGKSIDVHHFVGNGVDLEQALMWATMGVPELNVIAHTRYCTSDPDSPLPLFRDGCAVVFNGVISQESPENWPNTRKQPYLGRNDAEIALRFAQDGQLAEHGGSFAIGILRANGSQQWLRNGVRPLWCGEWNGALFRCSTYDIARRALGGPLKRVLPVAPFFSSEADYQKPSYPVKPCRL